MAGKARKKSDGGDKKRSQKTAKVKPKTPQKVKCHQVRPAELLGKRGDRILSKVKQKRFQNVNFLARFTSSPPQHGDQYILKKIFAEEPYEKARKKYAPADIQAKDLFRDRRVLDLGAHIGCFSVKAALGAAKAVVSVEADPDTHKLLVSNVRPYSQVETMQAAVVGTKSSTVSLYPKRGQTSTNNPRCNRNSIVQDDFNTGDGLCVPAKAFSEIMLKARPQVVKMDIEGEEWNVFATSNRKVFAGVEELFVFWHLDKKSRMLDFSEFITRLKKVFTNVSFVPTPAIPKDWNWQSELRKNPDLERKVVGGFAAAKQDVLFYCCKPK